MDNNLNSVRFDAGRVNLDPPITCADWPVAGNLTVTTSAVRRVDGVCVCVCERKTRHDLTVRGL